MEKLKSNVLDLILSGNFKAMQVIGSGKLEAYEGCENNLFMIITDTETKVSLLSANNSLALNGKETFLIEFDSFMWGACKIFICEA